MQIRRALAPTTLLLAGAVSLVACGSYGAENASGAKSKSNASSGGGVGQSAPAGVGAGGASTGASSGKGSDASSRTGRSGSGASTPVGGTQAAKRDANLPKVTKVDAPTGVTCGPGVATVDFTVRYSVMNAEHIEYLRPGADRPGADDATGSLVLAYDCSQPQQTFHIRAFKEFADNGSDAKDPSPYVSFPVTRNGTKSTGTTGSATKKSTVGKVAASPTR